MKVSVQVLVVLTFVQSVVLLETAYFTQNGPPYEDPKQITDEDGARYERLESSGSVNPVNRTKRFFDFFFNPISAVSGIVNIVKSTIDIAKTTIQIANDHKIVINIANHADFSFHISCSSNDGGSSEAMLHNYQVHTLQFTASFWGTTRHWCNVKNDRIDRTFPVYKGGAPNQSNTYELRQNGIYLNGHLFRGY